MIERDHVGLRFRLRSFHRLGSALVFAQEFEVLETHHRDHLEPMTSDREPLPSAGHRVRDLLEMDPKMRRTHSCFSHPPTLPQGSDMACREEKKFIFSRWHGRGWGA